MVVICDYKNYIYLKIYHLNNHKQITLMSKIIITFQRYTTLRYSSLLILIPTCNNNNNFFINNLFILLHSHSSSLSLPLKNFILA